MSQLGDGQSIGAPAKQTVCLAGQEMKENVLVVCVCVCVSLPFCPTVAHTSSFDAVWMGLPHWSWQHARRWGKMKENASVKVCVVLNFPVQPHMLPGLMGSGWSGHELAACVMMGKNKGKHHPLINIFTFISHAATHLPAWMGYSWIVHDLVNLSGPHWS